MISSLVVFAFLVLLLVADICKWRGISPPWFTWLGIQPSYRRPPTKWSDLMIFLVSLYGLYSVWGLYLYYANRGKDLSDFVADIVSLLVSIYILTIMYISRYRKSDGTDIEVL